MIRFWCGVVTLLLLLSLAYGNARWVERFTQDLVEQLTEAQNLAEEEQWKQASDLTYQAYEQWEAHSFPLYILLRHDDLDHIMITFQSISQYLEEEDKEPYTANNAQLMAQLTLLAEMEQCTLENIL